MQQTTSQVGARLPARAACAIHNLIHAGYRNGNTVGGRLVSKLEATTPTQSLSEVYDIVAWLTNQLVLDENMILMMLILFERAILIVCPLTARAVLTACAVLVCKVSFDESVFVIDAALALRCCPSWLCRCEIAVVRALHWKFYVSPNTLEVYREALLEMDCDDEVLFQLAGKHAQSNRMLLRLPCEVVGNIVQFLDPISVVTLASTTNAARAFILSISELCTQEALCEMGQSSKRPIMPPPQSLWRHFPGIASAYCNALEETKMLVNSPCSVMDSFSSSSRAYSCHKHRSHVPSLPDESPDSSHLLYTQLQSLQATATHELHKRPTAGNMYMRLAMDNAS